MKIFIPSFCFVLLLLSCNERDNGVGPCVHYYREPILHIENARDIQSGNYLRTIILTEIMIDSVRQDLFLLLSISQNVAVLDSSLVCNPPCSFGFEPGLYSFRVSASGYRDTVISVNANYSDFRAGCPSSSDGGVRIEIGLQAQ